MGNHINGLKRSVLALWLVSLLTLAGWIPTVALADGERGLNRPRSGREGDPLDGAEPDGPPNSGDDIHSTASVRDRTRGQSPNVILVPFYINGALTFHVIFVSPKGATHAW